MGELADTESDEYGFGDRERGQRYTRLSARQIDGQEGELLKVSPCQIWLAGWDFLPLLWESVGLDCG